MTSNGHNGSTNAGANSGAPFEPATRGEGEGERKQGTPEKLGSKLERTITVAPRQEHYGRAFKIECILP